MPEGEQPSRSASTLQSMEDSPIDNSKLWSAVFKLYDRDNSGFADEGDTVAAMVTMGREREQARKMLARRCEDGRPNLELFQVLLEECVSLNLGGVEISASDWQKELVKHLLGVLKEFERRALARGEFMIAAESRHRVKQLKEVEERRQKEEMVVRQGTEKSGVAEAHVREAVEFNKAWTTNMSEFELRATQIVQELRDRQETALAAIIETARAEAKARVKPSKVCTASAPASAPSAPASAPPPRRLCTPSCYVHARRLPYRMWLQPLPRMAAVSILYGCSSTMYGCSLSTNSGCRRCST